MVRVHHGAMALLGLDVMAHGHRAGTGPVVHVQLETATAGPAAQAVATDVDGPVAVEMIQGIAVLHPHLWSRSNYR